MNQQSIKSRAGSNLRGGPPNLSYKQGGGNAAQTTTEVLKNTAAVKSKLSLPKEVSSLLDHMF